MFRDKCGVLAIVGRDFPLSWMRKGLLALQHRGQESAGVAYYKEGKCFLKKGMGLVHSALASLPEVEVSFAIGHTRYSTRGGSRWENAQPLLLESPYGGIGIAHNGQILEEDSWRGQLRQKGVSFETETDTEIFLHLLAREYPRPFSQAVREVFSKVEGAFSVLLLYPQGVFAVRDPYGFRPLCLGRGEGFYVIASESVAFAPLGASLVREIQPGEVVHISQRGIESFFLSRTCRAAFCSFEWIYFSSEASLYQGQSVEIVRRQLGYALGEEEEGDADCVVPIPDSAIPAALGFSEAVGAPLELAVRRRPFAGRTFIEPGEKLRREKLQQKYLLIPSLLQGRSIFLVDDSLVRGNTLSHLVPLLRREGVEEIHLRIASPPIRHPCFYGVDTPTREELLASCHLSFEALAKRLGVDSLRYLSLEKMKKVFYSFGVPGFCDACFSGVYPTQRVFQKVNCHGSP